MPSERVFQCQAALTACSTRLLRLQNQSFELFQNQNQNDLFDFKAEPKLEMGVSKQEMNSPSNTLENSLEIFSQKIQLNFYDFENSDNCPLGFQLMDQDKYERPHFNFDCQMVQDNAQLMKNEALIADMYKEQETYKSDLFSSRVQSQFSVPGQMSSQNKKQRKMKTNQSLDEYKNLLKVIDIKNEKGKNTNLPKYVIRLLQDYLQEYIALDQVQFSIKEKLESLLRKILRIKYSNNPKNLALLTSFLKKSQNASIDYEEEEEAKKLLRQATRKILREKSMKEVVKNNRVTTKKTLLIGSKVYALRCMMSGLTQRLESA